MRRAILSDQQLISRYISGNQASGEMLLKRYQNRVYTYVLMLVRNTALAEDILQDTLIKVINTLQKRRYNEEGKFLPWVLRIAHNLVIDHYRRSNRMPMVNTRPTSVDDEEFDIFDLIRSNDIHAEDSMIREQIRSDLRELIRQLPKEQIEVLVMRHYTDMSFKEIAKMTSVSINTALGRMRYALINLRKMMKEQDVSLMAE